VGRKAVIAKAIEEYGEVISALAKYDLNGAVYGHNNDAIIDEIADAAIMTHQLALTFGIKRVGMRMDQKIERLEKLVKG
jgi:NTP pyrophosphatase (non-canonical NTP hydrolase)